MDYLIYTDDGYLDCDGSFGDIRDAITFDYYQALAICNATGWEFEETI